MISSPFLVEVVNERRMRSEFNAVEMPEKIAMCVLPRRHIALLIFLHIRRTEFIVRRGAAGDHAGRTNCKRTFPESFLFRQASSETLLYPNSSAARFAFAPLELKTTLSGQDARRFIEHHRDCPAGSRPMAKPRELRFNAFNMTAPSHNWAGLWSHPRDTSINYNSLDYWVDYARTAERGLLDGIFLADVFGVYDVFGDSPDTAIRHAVQLPNAEPTLLVSAMALATKHLGFGITANLTFEHPYQLARRFSTLDHLTNGRIGWNIVTGYLDSGARGMGLPASRAHDERYDAAEDFLQAAYKLWEGSWEDDAVRRDRDARIFTDPAKVHPVRHEGSHYRVNGIHLAEPSPQRTPLLYQAGTSKRGRAFAARHAEAIFLNGQTKPILARRPRDQDRGKGVRPRSLRHQAVCRRDRDRGADACRSRRHPRRLRPVCRSGRPTRAALGLDRHRLLDLPARSGRAICREQRDPIDGGEFYTPERSPGPYRRSRHP